MKSNIEIVKNYCSRSFEKLLRKPCGWLKYPFIVPGEGYTNDLWDWDSYFTDVALRQIVPEDKKAEIFEYEKGCVLNFLSSSDNRGRIPVCISPKGVFPEYWEKSDTNFHKPLLAQHAAFAVRESGESKWLKPHFAALEAFVGAYANNCYHAGTGLYFWKDDLMLGVDNDPCTFFRPRESSASVFLNCLMYQELQAMKWLSDKFGYKEKSEKYNKLAGELKCAVQENCWDDYTGFFYSVDINLRPINKEEWLHSGCPRAWQGLLQRIGVWSGFLGIWSGIATKEQARKMVEMQLDNPSTFAGKYGLRSLSKAEKMYSVEETGNPSCWLGPVWIIAQYLTFRGLINYGFTDSARKIAENTVLILANDIAGCGEMHEYYNPETGEGINNQGFQSWNLLVMNMISWLETGKQVEEFSTGE